MMEFSWLRYRFFVCIVVAASPLVSAGNITAKDLTTDWVRPPGPTTSCFVNSLTAPTWSVESFRYEGGHAVSTVSFTLTSNAIREELRCFGQTTGDGPKVDGDCTGEDGEHKYPAQFKFDASSLRLSIEQTWACDDNAAKVPVRFVGTGSKNIVLNCESDECTSKDRVRIAATLSKPLELSPYIPPAPPGHDSLGCTSRSKSPSWTISSFEWRTGGRNYTWQYWGIISGTGIAGVGMVRLNITNHANKQTFSCEWQSKGQETSNVTIIEPPSGVLPFPLDPGSVWYRCDTHSLNENENRAHNYEVETSMRLVSAEGKLLVNQTWYCDDEGPVSPVKFYATGVVELLNLTCRVRLEVEPDVADIYIPSGTPIVNGSVCFGSHFDIDGRIESRYELEPYALELPNPEAPKCTVISMDSDKQFFILDTSYVFRANWWYFEREGEPKGGFDVTIHNFVTERELGCSGFSSRLNPNGTDYDPDYWFECISLPSYPDLIRSIRVNYNSKSGILSVGMSWSCDELSPKSPIIFNAFGNAKISKPDCKDDGDGTTRCIFPSSGNVPLPFTNITWSKS